jgi:hypothetical protein
MSATSLIDPARFAYLQASRISNLDSLPSGKQRHALIDCTYSALLGRRHKGWPFHDADTLREQCNELLADLPALLERRSRRAWSVATGDRRRSELRFLLTDIKPALRALLIYLGEPVLEVWTAPYSELARLLESIPLTEVTEAATGTGMLALLDAVVEQSL